MQHHQYRFKSYLYYIFMDDDIVLENNFIPPYIINKTFTNEAHKIIKQNISPWRKFEHFLTSYKPAIGTVENEGRMKLMISLKTKEVNAYYGTINFDAQINAYHKDVISNLLPYNTTYDTKSWWISQELITCKTFFRYHGHVVIFLPLLARNRKHDEYPRGIIPIKDACATEYHLAPNAFKLFNISKRLLECRTYSETPNFLKYVAPPKTPIREYKYFNGNFAAS